MLVLIVGVSAFVATLVHILSGKGFLHVDNQMLADPPSAQPSGGRGAGRETQLTLPK